jgi:tetratricopeptide (TPR) repeat protein
MKTIMFKIRAIALTIVLTFVFASGLLAQNKSEYKQAMGAALAEMPTITDNKVYLDLANKFQRIAENEPSEWLPAYYNGLCTAIYSFVEKDKAKVDPLLDQAQLMVDKALKTNAKESEIWILQGMLYQARIMVDPMTRGQLYIQKANESFAKAEVLNPENPRVYYLQGQSLMNTPAMYGGGKDIAKPLFQKAHDKFLSFKPADAFSPNWGKEPNEQILKTYEK